MHLQRLLRARYCGRRNIIIRAMDLVCTMLLLWAGVYIVLFKHPARFWLSVLAGLLFFAAALCLHEFRFRRFCVREMEKMRVRLRQDALLLYPYEKLIALLQAAFPAAGICLFQQETQLTTNQLLPYLQAANRQDLHIFVTADTDPTCRRFLARQTCKVRICGVSELMEFAHIPEPTAADYERLARAEATPRRPLHGENSIISAGKEKLLALQNAPWIKYALLALLFVAISFLGRQVIYYRILAALASAAASFTLIKSLSRLAAARHSDL